MEEAQCQNGKQKLHARTGSEYANAAANFPQWLSEQCVINPTTGVRIHKHNPKGVPCENPPGGGMEGKAPWSQRSDRTGGKKKEVTATATEPKTSTTPPSTETVSLAISSSSSTSSTHH
ncbi:hypothetical protein BDR03DRAFT_982646 [Suillus americanus]|nr:hypothetical protein BDR03DRAFT_982646 [Suillus americanus]